MKLEQKMNNASNSLKYARLERLVNSVNTILCEVDPEGRILWINKYGQEFFGYREDELVGKNIYETVVPKRESTGRDLSGLLQGILENGSEIVPRINENVKKDGSRVWVYWSNKVLRDQNGKPLLVLSSGIDITEFVMLRQKLDMEHKRFSSLIRILNLLLSPDVSLEDLSEAVLQEAKNLTRSPYGIVATLDKSNGELIGHTLRNIVDCKIKSTGVLFPDEKGNYPSLLGHALNTRKAFYTNSPESHPSSKGTPEGHLPIRRFLAVPITITSKSLELIGIIALINSERDYSEEDLDNVRFLSHYLGLALKRKALEDAIIKSENFYKDLFERNPVPMLQVNNEDVMVSVNKAFEEVFGYSKDDLKNSLSWKVLVHPAEIARLDAFWRQRLSGLSAPDTYETKMVTKDGRALEVSVHIFKREKLFIAAVVNLTELRALLRKLEEKNLELEKNSKTLEILVEEKSKELIEKERLATMGELALMVGHDLRNPLQAILNSTFIVESIKENLPQERRIEFSKSIETIRRNISYMNKIVSDLQDFSRSFRVENSLVDLKAPIELALNDVFVPGNVTVEIDAENEKILLDAPLVSRALKNLINNGIQAMPSGGRLSVRARVEPCRIDIDTQNEFLVNSDGAQTKSTSGSYDRVWAVYTVADTGSGIVPEVLNKIFNPFITTKPKGTGLGLTIVKRIVDALGGTISVESELGVGTVFILKVPSEKPKLIK